MSEIVGIGAAVQDTLLTLPAFPAEDTKMRALALKRCGGGPAATGVVAAAKLGVSSGFLGVLADDDNGRFLREDFQRYGVDVSGIVMKPGFRSFTSYIWLNGQTGSRTCVFEQGDLPPLALSESQKRAVREARLLLVDGNELNAALEAARLARENGTIVLYDAGGLYEGVEKLLALADILIPSEEFALQHTGQSDARQAAATLSARYGARQVVITCGRRGGVLFTGGKAEPYPAYPVQTVDTNGAGDVFHGAFAAAVVRGLSPRQACRFSSAVAALKCTGMGARESVPDYDTAINFLRRNGYEF